MELTGHRPSEQELPLVYAVVVNWNGREDLLQCLSSLEKTEYPGSRLKVTVIDNASVDGSRAAVRERFPKVSLLENSRNLGYVAAVHIGAAKALDQGADYLWVFNNDVAVAPDALRALVAAAEGDARIAVAGPVIYRYEEEGIVEHAGYGINPWTGHLRRLRYGRDVFSDGRTRENVDSILGCSNLIRAAAWRELAGLDSVYGVYFEETDFNTRARRGGWKVVLVKDARVRHRCAATMNRHLGRRAWLLLRNLFIFQCRNAKRQHLFVFIPYYFLVHVPYFLIRGVFYAGALKCARAFSRNGGSRPRGSEA
jgi:hypothetical protein